MRLNLLLSRSGVLTAIALTGLMFAAINGELSFSRLGLPERWFGWPLIYYGDGGPGSLELTVYLPTMILNIAIDAFLSCCTVLCISFFIYRSDLKGFPYHWPVRMISIGAIGLMVLTFFGLVEQVSMSWGPRDALEFPKNLILGPRFVTNPMG